MLSKRPIDSKKLTYWINPRVLPQAKLWLVPAVYMAAAFILPQLVSMMPAGLLGPNAIFSHNTATTLLSAIATGMITFTGFVFSMVFVLIQASNTTFSPRISSLFLQDKFIHHVLGTFIATFLYALLAISTSDRLNFLGQLDYAILITIGLLVFSMIMFLGLIQKLTLFQIVNVLKVVGDRTYHTLNTMFPDPYVKEELRPLAIDLSDCNVTQIIHSPKNSGILVSADLRGLVALATRIDAVFVVEYAVGDTIPRDAPFIKVYGGDRKVREREVKRLVVIGTQRRIEDDVNYGLRLIVDIALRALSAAINDPATAVQALDQLENLLHALGQRDLAKDDLYDAQGTLRVIYPASQWEDYLSMALDEVRYYGEKSMQVMRRLRALLEDLLEVLPEERKPSVLRQLEHVNQNISYNFDRYDRVQAMLSDRQGIGVSRDPEDQDLDGME